MADTVVETLILDTSSFEKGASEVIKKYDEMEAKARLLAKENPFKGQADDVLKFNNQLRSGTDLFGKMASGPKATKAEVSRLSEELIRLIANQDKAAKSGNWKQTEADIKRTRDQIADINKKLNETPEKAGKVAGGFDKVGSAIKTAFTVTGILAVIGYVVDFGKKLIDITGIGQKYENQFARVFGGNAEAAKGYLSVLQTTADTTNFTFDTLADNASKLASRGIIPTKNELLGLGDVANFIGKDFGQLNESILDANNPERWKELGFVVKTQGDKMTLSYGDFSTTVDNSVKGAYNAIQAFSKLGKVQGSTVEAGETLSGQVSTLTDDVAGFFRTIGQGNSGVLNAFIGLLSRIVKGGIALVKTLQPAFSGLINVFSNVGNGIGSIFSALGNFQSEAEKSATTTQKFGYIITKYIVTPLAGFVNTIAGIGEGMALLVLYVQKAKARLQGDASLEKVLDGQIDAVKAHIAEIRKEGVKLNDAFNQDIGTYVRKDNQRNRREERRARLNEEELNNYKQDPPPGDKGKPDPKTVKEAAQERQKLLEDKKKFSDNLKALQEKYDKERLDTLDKNSQQYIDLKRKYDLEELEAERQKFILIGQDLTGQKLKNVRTGVKTTILNKDYRLPKETEDLYTLRKQNIIDASARDSGRLAEEQFEKERLDRTKTYRDAREQYEKEQANKHELLQRQSAELELELRQELLKTDKDITRQAGESELDYESRKNEALIRLRLDYYNRLLKLAEADPSQKEQVQGLKETIAEAEKSLKEVKDKGKTGPTNLFELLGVTFKDDKGNDITDKVNKQVSEVANTVISTANSILEQQISADQARVESIDAQLAAKQNEIDTEAQLAAAGLANNLSVKRQEQAALQAERQKALQSERAAQKVQLEINAILQASELALAVAKIFRSEAGIPVIGVIAAGIEAFALLTAFAATVSKIGSLPTYHDGDEVTHETARSRSMSGARKSDEVDVRLQVGEGVTRRKSYQSNKALLQKINALERPAKYEDIGVYFRDNPFEMDPAVKERDMRTLNQYVEFKAQPDRELHHRISKLENSLNDGLNTLIKETRKGNRGTSTQMPDGRVRHVDANGNVSVVSHF